MVVGIDKPWQEDLMTAAENRTPRTSCNDQPPISDNLFCPILTYRHPRVTRGRRTMDGVLKSLGRITKHLPNTTLDDRISRITIDARGKIWVTEDAALVLLKGHLLIEAELIDICGRLLKNPDALESGRVSFGVRLNLVRALVGEDALPACFWNAMKDINKIRNALAHQLEPTGITKTLHQFLRRFDEIEDCRTTLHDKKSMPERLISCFLFLCGALSGIENPPTAKPARQDNEGTARPDQRVTPVRSCLRRIHLEEAFLCAHREICRVGLTARGRFTPQTRELGR
jgi:hypothetical protein